MLRVVSPPAAWGSWVPDLKPLLDLYLARVRDRLGERVTAVALYGSVARGQAQAASDVDLFVVHRGARAAWGKPWRSTGTDPVAGGRRLGFLDGAG